ncbi:AAA family ATPase [Trichoderma pleuroticola]
MFLDQPLWLEGATSSRGAFAGNLPLRSVSSYLSKHPEICCIIYRDYNVSSLIGTEPQDSDSDALVGPEQVGEFIEPATTKLANAITKFFDYYKFNRDSTANLHPTKLIAPYVAIYHARGENLTCFLETLEHNQRIQFQTMLNYVFSRYGNDYSLVDEMTGKGKVTQKYIKYLFKPGAIIVHGKGQDARGYLCKSWLEDQTPTNPNPSKAAPNDTQVKRRFNMPAWSWDFDGKFSREQTTLSMEFDAKDLSEKSIEKLSIRPLAHLSESTKERLKNRGTWFWKCRTKHIVSYDDLPNGQQHSSDERYMVDTTMYRELHKADPSKTTLTKRPDANYLGPEAMKRDHPPDEDFFYLAPLTVSWNTQAFESLVLKGKTKRLIQALISNQIEAEKSTDLISGKGNGLILLLHGGPGTGKTLTAESDVENYLESVLYLGKTWGCVVLLDEADVFLEQRSLEDLHRNALVSVFLRVLEYYDGILILTSNRVGTFDEAFKSRIQLAVHYSSLTTHQRTKIWGNFIQRLKELNEDGIDFVDLEDNIEQLASKEMNGREIRNAITTARQYARWERQQDEGFKVNYKVMKEVIETAGEFDEYINTLNGGLTQEQLAKEDGIR